MTLLLAFSTAVIVYGALFGRAEPSFLLATPNRPHNIVAVMYLEALFFASWSLCCSACRSWSAIGPGTGPAVATFYLVFVIAFLGFVPSPARWASSPHSPSRCGSPSSPARRWSIPSAPPSSCLSLWGRLWAVSASESGQWLHGFLSELESQGRPVASTWVTNAIRYAIEDRPREAWFYLAVTVTTAAFFSWATVTIVGAKLLAAFGRAHSAPNRTRDTSGSVSAAITHTCFFYATPKDAHPDPEGPSQLLPRSRAVVAARHSLRPAGPLSGLPAAQASRRASPSPGKP